MRDGTGLGVNDLTGRTRARRVIGFGSYVCCRTGYVEMGWKGGGRLIMVRNALVFADDKIIIGCWG